MTTSLTALANAAAQDIGVLDSGESISAQQLADSLDICNKILDNWSSEGIQIPFAGNSSQALTAGAGSYTVGAAQTWNINPAPLRITGASLLMANGVTLPIKVVNSVEWDMIKDRSSSSNLIEYLFYTPVVSAGTPLGLAQVSAIPQSGGASCVFQFWRALTQFADTVTPIILPPGYALALELSLAKLLCPKFDMPWSQLNGENYQEAMVRARALNALLWGTGGPPQAQAQG